MGLELNRGDVLWFNMDAVRREFGISAATTLPQPVPSPQPWTCETVSVGTVTIPIEDAIDKGIVRVSRGQMVEGVGWVGAGGGGLIGRDGRSGAAWTTATGGNGGQSYIGEPASSAARGLPVSGGPQPVKPYIPPPERTPEEIAESGAWLITGKGNVYTLSSIGSACTFESLRERSEGGSGYLDSLDADHATPEEATAIKAHLRRLLDD